MIGWRKSSKTRTRKAASISRDEGLVDTQRGLCRCRARDWQRQLPMQNELIRAAIENRMRPRELVSAARIRAAVETFTSIGYLPGPCAIQDVLDRGSKPLPTTRSVNAASVERVSYLSQRGRSCLLCRLNDWQDVGRVPIRIGLYDGFAKLASLRELWASQ